MLTDQCASDCGGAGPLCAGDEADVLLQAPRHQPFQLFRRGSTFCGVVASPVTFVGDVRNGRDCV